MQCSIAHIPRIGRGGIDGEEEGANETEYRGGREVVLLHLRNVQLIHGFLRSIPAESPTDAFCFAFCVYKQAMLKSVQAHS